MWVREARHKDRLAEFIVTRYYGIHQPLLPGLAKLLTRAVDAGDRHLARLVRTVAAANQDLELFERHEPYVFLRQLVDGLIKSHSGWQGVADLTARSKAA